MQLLQLAVVATQAGVEIAGIVGPAIDKLKAAQASGVDLTDQDLQDELTAIKAAGLVLDTDPGQPGADQTSGTSST
jgi:hypothetical protein